MEFFDEVVIVGTGRDSALFAKDTILDLSERLDEEKLVTSFSHHDAPVVIRDSRLLLTSRSVFETDAEVKAFAYDISAKADEVIRGRNSILYRD